MFRLGTRFASLPSFFSLAFGFLLLGAIACQPLGLGNGQSSDQEDITSSDGLPDNGDKDLGPVSTTPVPGGGRIEVAENALPEGTELSVSTLHTVKLASILESADWNVIVDEGVVALDRVCV